MYTADVMSPMVLEPGTPVVILGLSKTIFETLDRERLSAMPTVFAGRLSERHDGDRNRGLILAPGPMAGSVPAKGIIESAGIDLLPDAGLVLLLREDEDLNGCMAYVVLVDSFGAVETIERRAPKDWAGFQACLKEIFSLFDDAGSDGSVPALVDDAGQLY